MSVYEYLVEKRKWIICISCFNISFRANFARNPDKVKIESAYPFSHLSY